MTSYMDRAGELLRARIGLRIEPALRGRIARAIRDVAAQAGLSADDYVSTLGSDPRRLQQLYDRVTVQESGFFRHPEQFEALAAQILPSLEQPVRIWSAGCGNGQEAYSMAMTLAETGTPGSVLATDLSSAAVERTRLARYSDRELAGLAPLRRSTHCERDGNAWSIRHEVRAVVTAEVRNLTDPLPADIASYHIVLCRNVLIYFTQEHATRFLDRLADGLRPGAHVLLGGAESMWHMSDRYRAKRIGDAFVYEVRELVPAPRSVDVQLRPRSVPVAPRSRSSARQTRAERRISAERAAPESPIDELVELGHRSQLTGDHAVAVRAFRQCTYLRPDDPVAHFHLAQALEASGDLLAARRAYRTTRTVLERCDDQAAIDGFGGYPRDDVARMLESKTAGRQ